MIDLDDLKDLRICRACKHVYMPDFEEDSFSYSSEKYPKNDRFCKDCDAVQEKE